MGEGMVPAGWHGRNCKVLCAMPLGINILLWLLGLDSPILETFQFFGPDLHNLLRLDSPFLGWLDDLFFGGVGWLILWSSNGKF